MHLDLIVGKIFDNWWEIKIKYVLLLGSSKILSNELEEFLLKLSAESKIINLGILLKEDWLIKLFKPLIWSIDIYSEVLSFDSS